jgi:Outer membrane protein beta-barrel domain
MRLLQTTIALVLIGAPSLSAAPATTEPATAQAPGAPEKKQAPDQKAPAATAKPKITGPRFTLVLLGAFTPGTLDTSVSRSFEEFTEMGSLRADHSFDSGIGGEIGLQYLLKKNLGVAASFSFLSRDGSATYEAEFPHPLLLNTPREASGTADGLSYKETAIHVDVVYTETKGAFTYALFAGPTFFLSVEADTLSVPQYSHSYPYDTVTVTSVPIESPSGSAFGFNLGGELGYRLAKQLDAGLRVRFSRATTDLDLAEGGSVEVTAGGFAIGVGIRIRF